MFPCACSLRSTQCAALIALAAVAGISRVEVGKTRPASEAIDASVVRVEQPLRVLRAASFYQVALNAFAPWLRLFAPSLAATATVEAAPSRTLAHQGQPDNGCATAAEPPRVLVTGRALATVSYFSEATSAPSARTHSFPYAVGPPTGGSVVITRRVVGTEVPGDSAARVELVEEFATVCFAPVPKSARHPSQHSAGSFAESEFRPARRAGTFSLHLSAATGAARCDGFPPA